MARCESGCVTVQITNLDFLASPKRASYLGAMLLALGAVFAGAAVMDDAERSAELDLLKSRLERTRAAYKRVSTAKVATPGVEFKSLKQFNDIARRLSLPWGGLLDALERADSKDVALLAIEPDAERGQLRLSGEARTMGALVDYINSLDGRAGIFDLRLVSQQTKLNDPQKPIEFALEAQWMQRPQRDALSGEKS